MSQRAGVVTGFVKRVDAEQGRVEVEYRGMQQSLLSPWAYVAAPLAGQGRGALFMPEENDEVLVCYEDGNFDHPFVVGFLWNGEQTSPETDAHNRVIVTPGGHQLRFEDKDNAKKVILKSAGARKLVLDDQGSGKVTVESGKHEIVMDDLPAGSKITISAGKGAGVTITMNSTPQPSLSISVAGNSIDVDASGLTVRSPGNLTIQAAGTADVTCTSATLTASSATINAAMLSVNAAMTTFSGVVQCTTLIASAAISSPVYSPGIGNLV
jgi:uncharacterized protein involved in type VI secretion and phage assembly